jgi:hypothetical protein
MIQDKKGNVMKLYQDEKTILKTKDVSEKKEVAKRDTERNI